MYDVLYYILLYVHELSLIIIIRHGVTRGQNYYIPAPPDSWPTFFLCSQFCFKSLYMKN